MMIAGEKSNAEYRTSQAVIGKVVTKAKQSERAVTILSSQRIVNCLGFKRSACELNWICRFVLKPEIHFCLFLTRLQFAFCLTDGDGGQRIGIHLQVVANCAVVMLCSRAKHPRNCFRD